MSDSLPIAQRILLYDEGCGFCQRWCNWARRRGAEPVIRFEPCQPARELRDRAGITEVDCGHAAFLVEIAADGRVLRTHRAAGAINGVLRRLPGSGNFLYRAVAVLYPLPGLKQLEELAYRIVARNRHRFGKDSCALK